MTEPAPPDPGERRREERRKTRLRAGILRSRSGLRLIDCVILNRSPHGARLILPEPKLLPLELELEDEADHRRYHVRIIRREGREIGIVVDAELPAEAGD